jgi:hypothetical protein
VNILLGYNFSEFTRFFPQGLKPFKIHRKFKLNSFPEFMVCILLRIEVDPIEKVVQNIQI